MQKKGASEYSRLPPSSEQGRHQSLLPQISTILILCFLNLSFSRSLLPIHPAFYQSSISCPKETTKSKGVRQGPDLPLCSTTNSSIRTLSLPFSKTYNSSPSLPQKLCTTSHPKQKQLIWEYMLSLNMVI